jgi:hypothetical protein
MYQYFGNSGTTLNIDLEDMIDSGPEAKARFRDEVSQAPAASSISASTAAIPSAPSSTCSGTRPDRRQ